MKTNLFWQGLSCVALVAALAVVVVHVTSARPARAGGGSAGGIIAVTEADNGEARLYLIDTNRKVVLVYGAYRQRDKFTMLAGRYFDVDAQATVGSEWPFKGQGYSITQMQSFLKRKAAPTRRK